jgi:hypothetical protein
VAVRARRWRSPATWLAAAGVVLYLAAFVVAITAFACLVGAVVADRRPRGPRDDVKAAVAGCP